MYRNCNRSPSRFWRNRCRRKNVGSFLRIPSCLYFSRPFPSSTHKKKRVASFTLFEVLIALSLLGILLTSLFTAFVHLQKKDLLVHQAGKRLLQKHYFVSRMGKILSSLHLPNGSPPFEEKEDGIYFSFDNGIDPDPTFSGLIEAKLEKKGEEIHLFLYPNGEKKKYRQESYLYGIEDWKIESLLQTEKGVHWMEGTKADQKIVACRIQVKGEWDEVFTFPLPTKTKIFPLKPR